MDGQRFDAFTRTLGAGISRRQTLKALLGGAAGVLVGTGVSQQAKAKDSTCDWLVSTQTCDGTATPLTSLDSCPTGYFYQRAIPTTDNTCSSVPDGTGLFKNEFRDACIRHDCCYGTCSSTKDQCDSAFLSDMRGSCVSRYSGKKQKKCLEQAQLYYDVVLVFPEAQRGYENLQLGACGCCYPESPTGTVVVYGFEPSGLVYEGHEDQQACMVRWYVTGFAAGTYAMTITVQGGQIEDLGPVVLSGPEEIIYMNVSRQIFDGDVIVMTVGGVSTDPLTVTC